MWLPHNANVHAFEEKRFEEKRVEMSPGVVWWLDFEHQVLAL
jgi:hypothetical protein